MAGCGCKGGGSGSKGTPQPTNTSTTTPNQMDEQRIAQVKQEIKSIVNKYYNDKTKK